MRAGASNKVTFADATTGMNDVEELDVINYMLSRDAGLQSKSFNEAVLGKCNITFEWRNKTINLTRDTLNLALTKDLQPFIKTYLAEVEKRGRSSEVNSLVEAPVRKDS